MARASGWRLFNLLDFLHRAYIWRKVRAYGSKLMVYGCEQMARAYGWYCIVEQLCPLHRGVLKCMVFGCFSAQLYSTMFSLIESFHERIADIREREHTTSTTKKPQVVHRRRAVPLDCMAFTGCADRVVCEYFGKRARVSPAGRKSTEELPFLIRRHP